jgi:SAM-dependent methyltransferase
VIDGYATPEEADAYVRRRAWRLSKRWETYRVSRLAGDAGRVIDVPCGGGRFAAYVAGDRSAAMAALAHAAGRRAIRCDVFALPFARGAFDTALCIRLLHHFDAPRRRAALGELRRVARRAVVTYFGDTGVRARRRAGRPRRTRRAVPRAEFEADCAAAGWRVLRDTAVLPGWSEQRLVLLAPR